eukprot:381166_1
MGSVISYFTASSEPQTINPHHHRQRFNFKRARKRGRKSKFSSPSNAESENSKTIQCGDNTNFNQISSISVGNNSKLKLTLSQNTAAPPTFQPVKKIKKILKSSKNNLL